MLYSHGELTRNTQRLAVTTSPTSRMHHGGHEEMEIHGQVHHSVSSRLFCLALETICLHAFAKSAVVQSGRQRVVMVHSVFSVLYPLQQEENIVMFDGQSDVDVAGLHEDETFNIWIMFTYGRSNFGCSRKRKTRSSG